MEAPLITIVIPVYNRARLVGHTLESIERQSHRPLRVILVDNNSTDDTLEVLKTWHDKVSSPGLEVTVVSETIPGAAAARQRAIELVTTPYIAFFDSDDTMHPDHVATLAPLMARGEADIIRFTARRVELDGSIKFTGRHHADTIFNQLFHSILATQIYVVKTDFIKRAGGWDPTVMVWNDFELGVRLMLNNPVIENIGTTLLTINSQAESITGLDFSSRHGAWEQALDTIEHDIISARRHDLLPWVETRRVQLAAEYAREHRPDLARPLLETTLAASRHRRRLKMLYNSHRLLGRGTAILARLLFW